MGTSEWYSNNGVYTQYGFEFQKVAFIYHILNNTDYLTGVTYIYEKDDDVKITNHEKTLLIQCKTSANQISTDIIYKTFKYWSDYYNKHKNEKITFILHTDNIFNIKKAKEKIINSNLYDTDTKNYIFNNLEYEKTTVEELFNNIKMLLCNKFFKSVINDNIKNDITHDFINYMLSLLGKKILNSKKDENEHGELSNDDIQDIIIELKDYKNNFNTNIDRKRKEFDNDIEELLLSNIKEEVRQLRTIDLPDFMIKKYIGYMMIYEYVKSNYDDIEKKSFDNNERQAFDNYEKVLYIDKPKFPNELFSKTIDKVINITRVAQEINQFVSDGCYIYLTKEDTPSDKRIRWEIK